MIRIKGVTKSYNKTSKAVDDITFDVNPGEIFGFLGPNGAGKSTTIKMMTGITGADSGTIAINGFDISADPVKAKQHFGYVPDSPDIFLNFTGLEYLNFMADTFEIGNKDRIDRISALAESFSMRDSLGDKIKNYSHGMRQKIVITGALIHDPENLILDEPLTGLDPEAAHTLKLIMRERCAQNKTVFFSTHVLEVAEKLCGRIGIINKGKLLFCGTHGELKEKIDRDASLENLFLELVK